MLGLLYKDFCNLKKQLRIVLLFVFLYGIYAVSADMPTIMGSLIIVFSIMMPITSMSYDESYQWNRYALSTPVTRKKLVLSKYVLGFLVALGGLGCSLLFSWLVCRITGDVLGLETFVTFGLFLEMGVLFLSFTIPVMFRYGVEKGRLLMMLFAVAPSLLMIPLAEWLTKIDVPLPPAEVLVGLMVASPLFILAIFLVSFRISVNILKKKEF